jgi:hypothetical protein
MCSTELAREPVGGEELGPLRPMMATGAGLSLMLNIVGYLSVERVFDWRFTSGPDYFDP